MSDASACLEVERDAVHAPAPTARILRPVVEHVPGMRAAAAASDLGSLHAELAIGRQLDGIGVIASVKLGQPVRESNFAALSKSGWPHARQW